MPASARHQSIDCCGSSQVENETGGLPCLRRVKRSSSAAATVRPSTTMAAAESWNTALIPRIRTHPPSSESAYPAKENKTPIGNLLQRLAASTNLFDRATVGGIGGERASPGCCWVGGIGGERASP